MLADHSSDQLCKLSSFHNQTILVVFDNTNVFGNSTGCYDVVSCYHSYLDTCAVALGYSIWHFLPWDVSDSKDTDKHELTFLDIEHSLFIFSLNIISV